MLFNRKRKRVYISAKDKTSLDVLMREKAVFSDVKIVTCCCHMTNPRIQLFEGKGKHS